MPAIGSGLRLRACIPLAQAARQIVAASVPASLQVLAWGSGDGILRTHLIRHLVEAQAPRGELCLLDISQPLLTRERTITPPRHWPASRRCRSWRLTSTTYLCLPKSTRRAHQGNVGCSAYSAVLWPTWTKSRGSCGKAYIQKVGASGDKLEAIKRRDPLHRGGLPSGTPHGWRVPCVVIAKKPSASSSPWSWTPLPSPRQLCPACRSDGEVGQAFRPAVLDVPLWTLR